MNIVSMVLQYLTPLVVEKLAASLALSPAVTNTVVKAVVPVILGAFAGKSAEPDGAGTLFEALARQDAGLLGHLSTVIGSPQQKTIAGQGSVTLARLLGSDETRALAHGLSKYANVDNAAATAAMGMLTPAVLATLGQQRKNADLDASGLAALLDSQKPNIAAAIPSDLAKLLAGSGLIDAMAPARQTESPRLPPVTPARPFNGWPWAALIAAAALFWGYWFGAEPQPWSNVPAPPRLMAGSTDVAGELDSSLRSLYGLLASVKDKSSAEAVVPRLELAQARFDRLDASAAQLSPGGRRILARHLDAWLPVITPVMSSLLANSGTAPILRPMLEAVGSRLQSLAKG